MAQESVSLSRFDRFIESRRAEATRRSYRQGIRSMVGEPEAFLELAERDKRKAEDLLIDCIVRKRGVAKGSTIVSCLARTKSFLDFYEVPLHWKKVKQTAPKGNFVSVDRAPLKEETRAMLDKAPLRERVASLVMASGGLRVGAFEYLDVGHFKVIESGVGVLKVYAGEPEEYIALLTPEAVKAVQRYFHEREQFADEKLTDRSPFLRNTWDLQEVNAVKRKRTAVQRYAVTALEREMRRLWIVSGVRKNSHEPGKRHEFKACHGLRKFAKTEMGRAGLSWEDSEVLLGHKLSYYKPTFEHLLEQYEKAVPFLTISELEEVKTQKTELETTYKEKYERLEGRAAIQEINNRAMEERLLKLERIQVAKESLKAEG